MTSVVISNHWHLLVDLSRSTSIAIQWHPWLPEIVCPFHCFELNLKQPLTYIFIPDVYHISLSYVSWVILYISPVTNLGILSTLLVMMLYLMSNLVYKYSCGPHSTADTHTRAKDLTVLAFQLGKSCNNLSDSSYCSYQYSILQERWSTIDVLIPRGCEMAMAPPLCKCHCQWLPPDENKNKITLDWFLRSEFLAVQRNKRTGMQRLRWSVKTWVIEWIQKEIFTLSYFVNIDVFFWQPSLSKSLGDSINWWDTHIPRFDSYTKLAWTKDQNVR